jgi:valyl-tRNA synthetase
MTTADRWILSRLSRVIAEVDTLLEGYDFGEAGRITYEFVWSEFCDWYIEISKIQLRGADEPGRDATRWVLYRVLEDSLKLLHPVMPYVTEAIWDHLPDRKDLLVVSRWPSSTTPDPTAEAEIEAAIGIVRAIRNVRAEFKVDAGRYIPAGVVAGALTDAVERQRPIIEALARVKPFDVVPTMAKPPRQAVHLLVGGVEIYLPLAGMVDIDSERGRASAELSRLRTQLEGLDRRLAEPSFLAKAPAAVVDKERDRRDALVGQIQKLEERLADLS